MLNYAINNEAIQVTRPVPLLTKNLTYVGGNAMAKPNVLQHNKKYQPNLKKRKIQTKDLIGKRFNRLTVIGEAAPYYDSAGQSYRKVSVECDCGNTTNVLLKCLKRGTTKSCGCLAKEKSADRQYSHGYSNHPLYCVWSNMNNRCNKPEHDRFRDWGGRGITVCDEWKDDPSDFIQWAELNGWKKGLVLDRENNDEGYNPSNCRFIDPGLSARNQRFLSSANKSGYRGVHFNKRTNKWMARIESNCKVYSLGAHSDPIKAAKAYDAKARELNAGHPLNFMS